MLDKLDLSRLMCLDIETVSQQPSHEGLDERWKALWARKAQNLTRDGVPPEELYERAGIYAEIKT